MISRVCDEFGCTPSVAERELDQHGWLVMRILESRSYAKAKSAWERAGTDRDARRALEGQPAVVLVREIETEIVSAQINEARRGADV